MAKRIYTWTALLLLGCSGDGEGYQDVPEPPDQSVAFASDAVQSGDQQAEFRSAALTSDCNAACTGACSEVCRQACQVCPSAVSCVGRIGAGTDCELGAIVCAAEHCPELLEGEDVDVEFGGGDRE
jgi:hypothetical protein